MFTLDEGYVEARFFMLMSFLGSPCVPRTIEQGQEVVFATFEDLENWEHDENLAKQLLVGRESRDAVELLEEAKPQFQSAILRNSKREELERFFG